MLKKSILYLNLFITLLICGIILLLVSFLYYKVSMKLIYSFNSIINTFRSVFANIKFISEMLIIYELSILENTSLKYEYQTNEYSLSCNALDYIYQNNITQHEIFQELSTCFPYFKPKVDELITGKSDKKIKNLIAFQLLIENDDFCKNYINFIIKNLDDASISDLKINKYIEYEKIKRECELIGKGLNSKGYSNVINGIYTTLNSLYNEFKNNNNRTSQSNYLLLNHPQLIMFQLESYYVLTKIPICYYIVINRDIKFIHLNAIKIEILLLSVQFLISLIMISVYFINSVKFRNEIFDVEFFNQSILHMILFE